MTECVFDNIKNCVALIEKSCANCSFCKTKVELSEGRKAALEHIRRLSEEKFQYINEKYHNGKLC